MYVTLFLTPLENHLLLSIKLHGHPVISELALSYIILSSPATHRCKGHRRYTMANLIFSFAYIPVFWARFCLLESFRFRRRVSLMRSTFANLKLLFGMPDDPQNTFSITMKNSRLIFHFLMLFLYVFCISKVPRKVTTNNTELK